MKQASDRLRKMTEIYPPGREAPPSDQHSVLNFAASPGGHPHPHRRAGAQNVLKWTPFYLALPLFKTFSTLSVMSCLGLMYTASWKIASYFLGLGDLLHNPVGPLKNLLQFFVLAGIEIFLEFTALALQVPILLNQLLLPGQTLAF